jgi:formimidoylglutamate deiminase
VARVDVTGALEADDGDRSDPQDADALVLPGFVNAHSHAFQRALRGRVELRSAARPHDDFWAWRTTMYEDARRLEVDDVEALAAWAYADMLKAGFTTVGEFHYLHHDRGGRPFSVPEMSLALARAAAAVGIRLVVLETAYARGGPGRPLTEAQRRFAFSSAEEFLAHAARAREALAPLGAQVGLALHSVRACPRPFIEAVAAAAHAQELVLHVHACEQRRELEECLAEHGIGPIALLEAAGALGPRTTIVHGTHVDAEDIARLAAAGCTVCLTPSTERNLGDGLCPTAELVAAGVPLCVGTDSHARIDLVDELRSLEDHERLRMERRNVLVPPGGRLAHALIPAGTAAGARALGAAIEEDRVVVDMPIEGRAADAADAAIGLDAWLVGGSSRDVRDVVVAGRTVVSKGCLAADEGDIAARARRVLHKLA